MSNTMLPFSFLCRFAGCMSCHTKYLLSIPWISVNCMHCQAYKCHTWKPS
jgi:hypothetical protein